MELIKTLHKYGCTLRIWDTYKTRDHKCVLRYELKSGRKVIFSGSDFCCSPMHAIDSIETAKSLLGFLTLNPGDTDKEYFAEYTQEQLNWCTSSQAEELSYWCSDY